MDLAMSVVVMRLLSARTPYVRACVRPASMLLVHEGDSDEDSDSSSASLTACFILMFESRVLIVRRHCTIVQSYIPIMILQ
jgi:hypothetical protein